MPSSEGQISLPPIPLLAGERLTGDISVRSPPNPRRGRARSENAERYGTKRRMERVEHGSSSSARAAPGLSKSPNGLL